MPDELKPTTLQAREIGELTSSTDSRDYLYAAARQQRQQYDDYELIIDIDAHLQEGRFWPEILQFVENDVLRQLAIAGRAKGRGSLVPSVAVGFQDMGGRVTRYPMRGSEKTEEKGALRDIQLGTDNHIDRIDVHYHAMNAPYKDAISHIGGVIRTPDWSRQAALDFSNRQGIGTGILSLAVPGAHFGDDAKARETVAAFEGIVTSTDARVLVGRGGSGSMPSSHAANWFAATMGTGILALVALRLGAKTAKGTAASAADTAIAAAWVAITSLRESIRSATSWPAPRGC